MSYQVTAPLVIAKDQEGRSHHCYEGEVISWLSAEQALHLLESGMVDYLGDEDGDDEDAVETEDDGSSPPSDDGPPPLVALKDAWVDYASSPDRGEKAISREEAEKLTKPELQEMFGA